MSNTSRPTLRLDTSQLEVQAVNEPNSGVSAGSARSGRSWNARSLVHSTALNVTTVIARTRSRSKNRAPPSHSPPRAAARAQYGHTYTARVVPVLNKATGKKQPTIQYFDIDDTKVDSRLFSACDTDVQMGLTEKRGQPGLCEIQFQVTAVNSRTGEATGCRFY